VSIYGHLSGITDLSPPLRYVFLLYNSTPEFENLKKNDLPSSHKHFDLKKFSRKAKFGAPIAGTFIYVSTNPDEIGTTAGFAPQATHKAAEEEQHFLVEEQFIIS
jgi:hypothetical protein